MGLLARAQLARAVAPPGLQYALVGQRDRVCLAAAHRHDVLDLAVVLVPLELDLAEVREGQRTGVFKAQLALLVLGALRLDQACLA